MVTLPMDAADDYKLVYDLIESGMDVARINCAHDDRAIWLRMIENINRAKEETGRNCRIMMDLAGPKLRTGDLLPGPGVVRIRPKRDSLGRVIAPRRVRFMAEEEKCFAKKTPVVPVPQKFITYAEIGDVVRFTDTRGKKRKLTVVRKDEKVCCSSATKPLTYRPAQSSDCGEWNLGRRSSSALAHSANV